MLMGGGRVENVDINIDALIEVAIADMHRPTEPAAMRLLRETAPRTFTMDPGTINLALATSSSQRALRCSPPGSEVVVQVSDSRQPLALILDVGDHGPGIPADRLPAHAPARRRTCAATRAKPPPGSYRTSVQARDGAAGGQWQCCAAGRGHDGAW